jgi:hypothetical protein
MKEVFMVAFGFGVAANQRTPLPLGASREVFDEQLLRSEDRDMIRAALLVDNESALATLDDSDQLLQVAQEYANTGIRIMRNEYLSAQPEQSLAAALLSALAV